MYLDSRPYWKPGSKPYGRVLGIEYLFEPFVVVEARSYLPLQERQIIPHYPLPLQRVSKVQVFRWSELDNALPYYIKRTTLSVAERAALSEMDVSYRVLVKGLELLPTEGWGGLGTHTGPRIRHRRQMIREKNNPCVRISDKIRILPINAW